MDGCWKGLAAGGGADPAALPSGSWVATFTAHPPGES